MLANQLILGMNESPHWLWLALSNKLSITLLIVIVLSIAGLGFALQAAWRFSRAQARRRLVNPLVANEGTIMIQMVLIMPILLYFCLMLAQSTFLMTGNIMVNYAAFAATRTAITQIPADYTFDGGDRQNVISTDPFSLKFRKIREAASIAVAPVSGRIIDSGDASQDMAEGIASMYQAYGRDRPRWTDTLMPHRFRYALAHTDIMLYTIDLPSSTEVEYQRIDGSHEFGPKEPVTVEVTHKFYLSMPWIGAFFSEGNLSNSEGNGRYTTIKAAYTLTNEGIITAMPEEPPLIRNP